MTKKTLTITAGLALAAACLPAQDLRRVRFSGVLSDYTPSTVAGGPYEMRGTWSLDIDQADAKFSAGIAMETSDYGVTDTTQVDPANPATRGPHTHHLSVTKGTVSYDTSVCPANNPPTTGAGIVVTGAVTISGNGAPAPFESKGASTVQICIIGGPEVEYSNLTVTFSGPATGHFGTQPIHGVVSVVSAR
ncbi:MAG TPA: hypothetical protein VKX49_17325 [Bryobacteraceae bacterium]|nr:hypothetical protein [Bryobacteraceae bacterium]